MRVLIIDDDSAFASMLAQILTQMGHSCRQASCPDLVAPADLEWAELLMLDIVMPVECMDGVSYARWLSKRRPDKRVVLMSASDPRVFAGYAQDRQGYWGKHDLDDLEEIIASA